MKGFTLLETLVAVTILLLAITGPLVVADRTLVAAQIAGQELTATSLAQEGIEYVRAMRDHEFLVAYGSQGASADAWNNFISGTDHGSITSCESGPCTVDPTMAMGSGSSIRACNFGKSPCYPLYLVGTSCMTNPSGCYYTQKSSPGSKSPFTRTIQATVLPVQCAWSGTDCALSVVSTVYWNNRGQNYSVHASDTLTPWQ